MVTRLPCGILVDDTIDVSIDDPPRRPGRPRSRPESKQQAEMDEMLRALQYMQAHPGVQLTDANITHEVCRDGVWAVYERHDRHYLAHLPTCEAWRIPRLVRWGKAEKRINWAKGVVVKMRASRKDHSTSEGLQLLYKSLGMILLRADD